MSGAEQVRRRRLAMRAWRRGMREMDLVLGPFADARLAGMDGAGLDAFEALLAEEDHELLAWVLGQRPAPPHHAGLVAELAALAQARRV